MNTMAQALVLAVAAASVATAPAGEPKSVLQQVERRVKSVLAGLAPAPPIEYPEYAQSLIVRYRPQKFLVHGRSKSGEWSTNVVEEIGPSFTGCVLRIHLERLGEVNQAATPQTIQEPYWQTLLDVTPVAGTTNQTSLHLQAQGPEKAGGLAERSVSRKPASQTVNRR
jgi:hypothetical protein